MLIPLKEQLLRATLRRRSIGRLSVAELESKRVDASPNSHDSSFFAAIGDDQQSVVTRLGFRFGKPNETWLSLRLGGRVATLKEALGSEGDGFQQGALAYDARRDGECWGLSFDGQMNCEGSKVDARVQLEFEGTGPLRDLRESVDQKRLASALATRKMSRRFFDELDEAFCVRTEQIGRLRGHVTVDGESHELDWPAVRDHSFGKQSWPNLSRHFRLVGMLEDGRSFSLSRVKYAFAPEILVGYVAQGDALETVSLSDDIAAASAQLRDEGSLGLAFRTDQGGRHQLSACFDHEHCFEMDEGAYVIVEKMAHFALDGVPGRGIAEFGTNPLAFPHLRGQFD